MSDQHIEETERFADETTTRVEETASPQQEEADRVALVDGATENPAAVTPGAVEEAGRVPGGPAEATTAVAQGIDVPGDAGEVPAEGQPAADDEASTMPRRGGRRAQLEREGEVAADFLETLLDICDLDGDLDVDIDGDRAAVSIVDSDEGRVPRRLVGQDGQVLEALQELTRLAVQSETGERSRLMLDVAGHRAERRATLVALAQETIAEVRRSGESVSLAPMSAFERKVVHDEVLAAGLQSESEGTEPRRFVVISPIS